METGGRALLVIRKLLTGVGVLLGVAAGIILLSNLMFAFGSKTDTSRLYVYTYPGRAALTEVVARVPGTRIIDASSGLVEVPAGQAVKYRKEFLLKDGVRTVLGVTEPPKVSFKWYKEAVERQLKEFADGNFGAVYMRTGKAVPIGQYLRLMLETSMKYYLPGLLAGVAAGYTGAYLAARLPRAGRVMDGVHGVLLGIPDFFLVVLLQVLGIYLVRWTDDQVFKILQYNSGTPFLIPFVTIAVFPALLVYGTLRLAIEREWKESYILTAYAKGLSYPAVIRKHILRNTREDVLAVLPKAVTASLAGMVIAEGLCQIIGIGGYYINPKFAGYSSLTATCIVLGGIALVLQLIIHLLRLRFTVRRKEAHAA